MEINWAVIAVFDPSLILHHIPSPLRPYILYTLTIKMSERQSIHFIHQAFPPKLNKSIVIYFIRPDKNPRGRGKTNRKRRSGEFGQS